MNISDRRQQNVYNEEGKEKSHQNMTFYFGSFLNL